MGGGGVRQHNQAGGVSTGSSRRHGGHRKQGVSGGQAGCVQCKHRWALEWMPERIPPSCMATGTEVGEQGSVPV